MILVSGGFDPLHTGHLDYLIAASVYGNVVVALNSDEWLLRKKGYVFMPWDDRRRIVNDIRHVHKVISVDDSDNTVCEALRSIKPFYFANGGDRENPDPEEHKVCKELDITEIFGIGGKKVCSSSKLVDDVRKSSLSWNIKNDHS